MRALWMVLVLSVATGGADEEKIRINKCCGEFQMLSGDGKSCVNTTWPRNNSALESTERNRYGNSLVPSLPRDASWVNRWLPPGIPLDRIKWVELGALNYFERNDISLLVRAVETSAAYDERQAEAEGATYWNNRVVFDRYGQVLRSDFVQGYYVPELGCVDVARPPLAPFVLLVRPNCEVDECTNKCCPKGETMTAKGDVWMCLKDARGYWSPANSSFARFLTPDWPTMYRHYSSPNCASPIRALRMSPLRVAPLLRRKHHNFRFSTWQTCADYERHKNGSLSETVFYCEESRITRGVYWMLRPLCFLSASLLLVALLSVALDAGNRRKVHGWCLACHGVCLLAFNMGQITYYLTISDEIDVLGNVAPHLKKTCTHLGKG